MYEIKNSLGMTEFCQIAWHFHTLHEILALDPLWGGVVKAITTTASAVKNKPLNIDAQ